MSNRTIKKPTIRNNHRKLINSVAVSTAVSQTPQGSYVALGTINGKEYRGKGESARLATLDLRNKFDKDVKGNDIPTRG